jgi:hypothetical protein
MLGARSAWIGCVSACVWSAGTLSACQAFDASKLDILLSPIDTPPVDAGGRDTGVDEPCTTFKAEVCNNLDDDCDDKVDENADESCFQPQSSSVCSDEGRCIVVSCDTGYVDCNDLGSDGCEHLAADGPCPNECEEMCFDAGDDSGQDSGPDEPDEPEDAEVEDAAEDAAIDEPDACVEQPEACDGMDNDCDDKVDETAECAIERCVDTVPSYRGEACDRCVCEKCGAQRAECQEHPNATWREQCRDVLECYVVQARAGNCDGADCYATGACSAEINIAAGGVDGDDGSGAIGGNCTWVNPPTHACMGATRYRDQCTLDLCEAECAQ